MPISKTTNVWSPGTVTYRGTRTKAQSGAEADVTILVGFIPHNGRQPHPVYCELLVHKNALLPGLASLSRVHTWWGSDFLNGYRPQHRACGKALTTDLRHPSEEEAPPAPHCAKGILTYFSRFMELNERTKTQGWPGGPSDETSTTERWLPCNFSTAVDSK